MSQETYPSKRDVIKTTERSKELSEKIQGIDLREAKDAIFYELIDDLEKYSLKLKSQGVEEDEIMQIFDKMGLMNNQGPDVLDLRAMYEAGKRNGLDGYALGLIKAALTKVEKLSGNQQSHFVMPMKAKVDLLALMANASKVILTIIAYAVVLLVMYSLLIT